MDIKKYLQPYKDVWLEISNNEESYRAKELLLSAMIGYLQRVLYVPELGVQVAIDEEENMEEDILKLISSWENGESIEDLVETKSAYKSYNEAFQM